ncbi:MAG TPA: glycosyltransferase [Solirubrobacteraceae bacterium]|nr:glycosyltransferase [Solirubrobacteraceae bacterium]
MPALARRLAPGQPIVGRPVDVVVVTADTRDLVLRCLERLDDPVIASVTVVDNGSRDGTIEAVRSAHPDCRVVSCEPPVGYATACNRGAAGGAGELILFLNSDILAHDGAVGRLAGALAGDPAAVAAGGRLVDPGTLDTQHRYGPKPFPTLATLIARLSGLEQLWPGNPWTTSAVGSAPPDTHTTTVDQPAGACLLVERRVFDAIGGFDDGFWFWYEDVDLARRLTERGRLLYAPDAVFEHVGGASFARWGRAEGVRSLVHGIVHYAETAFDHRRRVALAVVVFALSAPRAILYAPLHRDLADAHRAIARAAVDLALGRPVAPLMPIPTGPPAR